jgi:outer membrane lipoprotein carrier protein
VGFRIAASAAFIAIAALLSATGRGAEPTAVELAEALQRKYASVRDFSADFTQQTESGALKRRLAPERGKVWVKKPGKMRWDYSAPEEKQFVSDGANFFSYIRQDRQVIITPVPPSDQATTPVLFLAGKGNLTRDFTPSITTTPAGLPAGTRTLKLTPKTPQPDYEWLTLSFDAGTSLLRGLASMDSQGRLMSITFTNLKENVGLADTFFAFKPPSGVEVVADTSRPEPPSVR